MNVFSFFLRIAEIVLGEIGWLNVVLMTDARFKFFLTLVPVSLSSIRLAS